MQLIGTNDAKQLLEQISFYHGKCDVALVQIAMNKYKVITPSEQTILTFYEINEFSAIDLEARIWDSLFECGLRNLKILDYGSLANVNLSYKVVEFRREIALETYLDSSSVIENYDIGTIVGEILYRFHALDLKSETGSWNKRYSTDLNVLLFNYGNLQQKGAKDYLLLDYITANRKLLKNTTKRTIHGSITLKNIRVDDAGLIDLRGLRSVLEGDPIYDMRRFNHIGIRYPSFVKGIIDAYMNSTPPRIFFRLLSFYTAVEMLHNIVLRRTEGETTMYTKDEELIFDTYQDFTLVKPSWYLNAYPTVRETFEN